MDGIDRAEVLERALVQLRGMMTEGTYQHLAGAYVQRADPGHYRIALRNDYAVKWMNKDGLRQQVLAVLKSFDPTAEAVDFVAPVQVMTGDDIRRQREQLHEALHPEPEAAGDQVDVTVHVDPELARFDVKVAGWSMLANYATTFWSELLGPTAFLTWLTIKAEDIRRKKDDWTPAYRFSVSRLARVAAGGNNQAITGVWRTCRSKSILERGEPCDRCKERGGRLEDKHTCRYWRPGAFDILQQEGIARVQRLGEGLATTYRIKVYNVPPLLTPRQVERLHPVTQEDHDRWLRRQDLDLESWERLTVDHLVGLEL